MTPSDDTADVADADIYEPAGEDTGEIVEEDCPAGDRGGEFPDFASVPAASQAGGRRDATRRKGGGKRALSLTESKSGRYISSRMPRDKVTDLAFDATLRAAAPYQRSRRNGSGKALVLKKRDLREKVRITRARNAICFVVDASWSMAARQRLETAKVAIMQLLIEAYQGRDQVGLVSFCGEHANLLLPLTGSVEMAQKKLQVLTSGGKTPLSQGLLKGFEVLKHACIRDAEVLPLMVLLTDGQASVSITGQPPQEEAYRVADFIASQHIPSIVIDTEQRFAYQNTVQGFDDTGRYYSQELAHRLRGMYCSFADIQGVEGLANLIRNRLTKLQASLNR